MHDAGIEVILDVVYNHTAEGNQLGPTLSFRGIDNRSYYSLMPGAERYYRDFTGTGNALEPRHPYVLRMVMDSLRYWGQEMGVDGFRFDLATTLARVNGEYNEHAGFLDAMAQDPALSAVKLIAEPWDTGAGGYQFGNFPPGWAEWNDRYPVSGIGTPYAGSGRVTMASYRPSPRGFGIRRLPRSARAPSLGQHQLRHRCMRSDSATA